MKFNLTARVEKQLWSGSESTLYRVLEQQKDKEVGWAVFCKQQLAMGDTYEFTGYVSTGKDKKRKGDDGKDIYTTSFNAETVDAVSSGEFDFGPDPKFNTEDIPF